MTPQTHSLFIYLLFTFIYCMSFVVVLNFFSFSLGKRKLTSPSIWENVLKTRIVLL